MEAKLSDDRMKAKLELVAEHIRRENLHELDGILDTFGPEARYDDEPWADHRVGRDQVRLYYMQMLAAAPDLHIEVMHRYATGEAIILEVMISGTHMGDWRGLPATGRSVRFPLCAIYSFDQGDRLSGERIYYDRASVLGQLGVFREPTGALGRLLTAINHPLTIAKAFVRNTRSRRD